jgi:hypothetical protein
MTYNLGAMSVFTEEDCGRAELEREREREREWLTDVFVINK